MTQLELLVEDTVSISWILSEASLLRQVGQLVKTDCAALSG
jgi:hypothetical protein